MSSRNVKIRKGIKEDCEDILQLLQALAWNDQHDHFVNDINELRRDGFEGQPWFHTFVAELKEEDDDCKTVVGMILYFFSFSILFGRCAHLDAVYVNETMRGRGLGTRLIKEVAKAAVANQCKAIHIPAMGANTNAIKLYKTLGAVDMTEDSNVHQLSLSEPHLSHLANS